MLNNCDLNWSKIKEQSWQRFPERQLFIDDKENIFAMKRRNGNIVVVGYMHYNSREMVAASDLIKFANSVIALAKDKYNTSDIVMITNMWLKDSKNLPQTPYPEEATYYHIDYKGEIIKTPLSEIYDNIKSKVEERKKEKIRRKNDPDVIDEEAIIMNAIKYGYGDNYGYG